MTEYIAPELIEANPFQTRTSDDPEKLQSLAENIAAVGLLHVPTARAHPTKPGSYQLAFGHRRLEAWKLAKPGLAFPLEIRALTDIQMSDLAAWENAQRNDISPIEIAHAIKRRMEVFGLTQLEAGQVFGYASASGVSNVLRLLNLPASIQQQVQNGEMSEHIARQLIPIARVAPGKVESVAAEALRKQAGREREKAITSSFDDILRKSGKSLNMVAWELSWPKATVSTEKYILPDKGGPAQFGACRGCESFVESDREAWCTRPPCLALKARVFAHLEAERVSGKLKIAVAADGEKVQALADDYSQREFARRVIGLKSAREWLRLMPIENGQKNWTVQDITGSYAVNLGTTDLKALQKAVRPKPKKKGDVDTAGDDDDGDRDGIESQSAQDKKRLAQQAKDARTRTRAHAECERLLTAATKELYQSIPGGELLDMLVETSNIPRFVHDFMGDLPDLWDRSKRIKVSDDDKRRIVMGWLLEERIGRHGMYGAEPAVVRNGIDERARGLKVKLSKTWDSLDVTPYLTTDHNCWHCGAEPYQGQTKIAESQVEQERGWVFKLTGNSPDGLADILCPECAKALPAEGKSKKPAKKAK